MSYEKGILGLLLRNARLRNGVSRTELAKKHDVRTHLLEEAERNCYAPTGTSFHRVGPGCGRLAEIYHVNQDVVFIATGRLPYDVKEAIIADPGIITEIRELIKRRKGQDD